MSIASYSYNPKSFQSSNDLQDMRQQIKLYQDQNNTLKQSLQVMIKVNTQLIDSIQQYAKLYGQGYGAIDQQQLQGLNQKVQILQKKINQQKFKTNQRQSNGTQSLTKSIYRQSNQNQRKYSKQQKYLNDYQENQSIGQNVSLILNVIQQLSKNFQLMQQQYSRQMLKFQQQLISQKQYTQSIFLKMQKRFKQFNQLFKQLVTEINCKQQVINNLNRQLSMQKNKKSQIQKQMKISLTIQDLKNTLQKKIQQKQNIIKIYQNMIVNLKQKFKEKI